MNVEISPLIQNRVNLGELFFCRVQFHGHLSEAPLAVIAGVQDSSSGFGIVGEVRIQQQIRRDGRSTDVGVISVRIQHGLSSFQILKYDLACLNAVLGDGAFHYPTDRIMLSVTILSYSAILVRRTFCPSSLFNGHHIADCLGFVMILAKKKHLPVPASASETAYSIIHPHPERNWQGRWK